MEERYKTLEEFWPFYLGEHQNETNRLLHFIGSSFGLFFLFSAFYKKKPTLVLFGLIIGYAFAWFGHFIIEKNRPATFKYPLKSFISDWKMLYFYLSGSLDKELVDNRVKFKQVL